jgi:hypothetical protein
MHDDACRIPSSHEYVLWVVNRRARVRGSSESCRIAKLETVLRLLAPDRIDRGGSSLVVASVFPNGFSP